MIRTHFSQLTFRQWTPVQSTAGRSVFWQFLPPVIALWVRVDANPAVQVRDFTTVKGTSLQLYTLCEFYQTDAQSSLTFVEYEKQGEYEAEQAHHDSTYSGVLHGTGCPLAEDLSWGPGGWVLETEVIAYGGNNDGAPAVRVDLRSLMNAHLDVFFVPSPGIRRIVLPCVQIAITRFDWTGGANLPTIDVYARVRFMNVGIT